MIGIFGTSGFIGTHLLRHLSQAGVPVRGASRRPPLIHTETQSRNAEHVSMDINAETSIASALQGIDTVVQLISTSSPGLQNRYSEADIKENVIPHVNFLRIALDCGVKRYIFLSSGGTVYGPSQSIPIREDAGTTPISSHGLTKLTIEKYLQMHGIVDDLDYVILRLSNAYGPGQHFRKGQGLIPAVLDRHRQGLPIQVIGGGTAQRDYVYIDDVVEAIVASISAPEAQKQILNIGSGQPRSVLEVLHEIEAVLGTKLDLEMVGARNTDVDANALDISRAKDVLGWAPRTPFRKGLERMILADQSAVKEA